MSGGQLCPCWFPPWQEDIIAINTAISFGHLYKGTAPPSVARLKQHRHPRTLDKREEGWETWIKRWRIWRWTEWWRTRFMKERDVEDVSPFLSVFLYYPAILFVYVGARVCMCVCVVYTYSRPHGHRWINAWTALLPLQSLGLNAKAKKRRK